MRTPRNTPWKRPLYVLAYNPSKTTSPPPRGYAWGWNRDFKDLFLLLPAAVIIECEREARAEDEAALVGTPDDDPDAAGAATASVAAKAATSTTALASATATDGTRAAAPAPSAVAPRPVVESNAWQANTIKRSTPNDRVVLPTDMDLWAEQPTGGTWHQVFTPARLLQAVSDFNAGITNTDRENRPRDAAIFRNLIAEGPWRRVARPADPTAVLGALRSEAPHMGAAIEVVAEYLALNAISPTLVRLPPMLLVGTPGVGKTYFATRLAELLGVPLHLADMSAQQTNSLLHGTERHWANTTPGLLWQSICASTSTDDEYAGPEGDPGTRGIANPLILLDELDKVSRRAGRYDPLGPLHQALEVSTARRTTDQSIGLTFDASLVSYVATANRLSGIPESLLSRITLVHCAEPSPAEALAATKAAIAKLMASELGRSFKEIDRAVAVTLAGVPLRRVIALVTAGMARASAAGRRVVRLADVAGPQPGPGAAPNTH